jgi:ferrous iron transport protein A
MRKTGVVIVAGGDAHRGPGGRGRAGRVHWGGSRRGAVPEHHDLARLLIDKGGYDLVEVGFDGGGKPSIEDAVQSVIGQGASRVVLVPSGVLNSGLGKVAGKLQRQYPGSEIVYVQQPVDTTRHADWIIERVREHDPAYVRPEATFGIERLGRLETGQTAVIHDFDAGHTLVSRLSALGFTPGARVTMIQNFGHGPVIVNVRDTRIALGRGEAAKVRVRDIGCGE